MVVIRYLMLGVTGIAPIAAIACLLGTFFGLGGWGWILFMWFGFTGMFAMGAAKSIGQNTSGTKQDALLMSFMALLLILAFVGGAAFALSDLPNRVSVFYVLLAPLLFIPIALIKNRAPAIEPRANPLDDFSKAIEHWPPEQARIALQLIKATLQGDGAAIDRLYPELTVEQFKAVEAEIRKMEAGQRRAT